MNKFLRLPDDPSGYGDFGVSYISGNVKIHFIYSENGKDVIGELYFQTCLNISVMGSLKMQNSIDYDTVFSDSYSDDSMGLFRKFFFILSGSDFQFTVVARECIFSKLEGSSILIVDDT